MHLIQLISISGKTGADRVAVCLGAQLQAEGHQVSYAVNPELLTTHQLPTTPESFHPIQQFKGLPLNELHRFNLWASGADIVLTHDSGARRFALLAKMLGLRPRVWFMRHCISGTTRYGGVQMHRILIDHQIAASNAIYQSLLNSGYPKDGVTRIYGTVDLEPFLKPDPALVATRRAELLNENDSDVITVGMVARIDVEKDWRAPGRDQKGFGVLFSALSRVSFPYRVLIFGPDSPREHDTLRQMATYYGINPAHIKPAGFIQDMSSCYPLLDINVLPSRQEGLGLALIEGMAAACASIGSRSGGIPEIISHEKNGLLFEEGDTESLAACLERLATNREYRAYMGKQAQTTVQEKFGIALMVEDFTRLACNQKK
jgi:glycosyltransferase involved in cell wall biosynthesis